MRQLHRTAGQVRPYRLQYQPILGCSLLCLTNGAARLQCAAGSRSQASRCRTVASPAILPCNYSQLVLHAGPCTAYTCQLVLTDAEEAQRGKVRLQVVAQGGRQGPCQRVSCRQASSTPVIAFEAHSRAGG